MRRLMALIAAFLPMAAEPASADIRDTLNAARAAYYDLRREGLTGFSCTVSPDWNAISLARGQPNSLAEGRIRQLLSAVTITLHVGSDFLPKVTSQLPLGTPAEMQGVRTLAAGVEEALNLSLQIWRPFAVASSFFPDSALLSETDGQLTIEFKDVVSKTWLTLRNDYAIDRIRSLTPGFESTGKPQFTKTAKGLILTGIQGDIRPMPSGIPISFQLRLDYQEVGAFSIPRRIILFGNVAPLGRIDLQAELTNCDARA